MSSKLDTHLGRSGPGQPHQCHQAQAHLLVHLEPGRRVLDCVLQTKEPGFAKAQGPADQVKQVLALPLHLQGKKSIGGAG